MDIGHEGGQILAFVVGRQGDKDPATDGVERAMLAGWHPRGRGLLLDGHALGQIAGLVDVAAAEDGDVVGEQLQRDGRDDRLQKLGHRGNSDHVVGEFAATRWSPCSTTAMTGPPRALISSTLARLFRRPRPAAR